MKASADQFQQAKALIEQWKRKYPAAFDVMNPLPLAIGIRKELAAGSPGVEKKTVGLALRLWCGRGRYLKAVAARGSRRVDLRGRAVSPVSAEHRKHAYGLRGRRYEAYKRRGGVEGRVATLKPSTPVIGPLGRPILKLKPTKSSACVNTVTVARRVTG